MNTNLDTYEMPSLSQNELENVEGGFVQFIGPICGLIAVFRFGFEVGQSLAH